MFFWNSISTENLSDVVIVMAETSLLVDRKSYKLAFFHTFLDNFTRKSESVNNFFLFKLYLLKFSDSQQSLCIEKRKKSVYPSHWLLPFYE